MMQRILRGKKYKNILLFILLAVLLLASIRCMYWYRQWQAWKTVNDRIFSYEVSSTKWKDREEVIGKWQGADREVLDIIQREADACGLRVLSFYASPQEKSQYNVELSGSYGNYIYFFNQLEREGPFLTVSLVRMERQDDGIAAVIKI